MGNGVLTPVYLRSTDGHTAAIDASGNVAVNASVVATANISGQPVNLVSGTGPISIQSGVYLASGISVVASVTAQISGQSVALFSGSNNVREVGSSIINSILSGATIITGNSGGNVLFSGGPFLSVLLRSASGNNPMWIGQPNTVTAGIGVPIFPNESLTFKVSNFNAIGAFAVTSGQNLYYVGLQ